MTDLILLNRDVSGIDFWKLVDNEKVTNLGDNMLRVYLMFGGTLKIDYKSCIKVSKILY